MQKALLFFFFLSLISVATAQTKSLEGLWRGTITTRGLEPQADCVFELYLQAAGKNKLKGRAYIYLPDGQILETQVNGTYYGDRSADLFEVEFIERTGQTATLPFYRKYQFIHQKSIFESENKIKGYWQELPERRWGIKREQGRIYLERVKESKA